jgi:hypothetical protein
VIATCPWVAEDGSAREQARRVGAQIQARGYLLWLLEQHPPGLTVAHGIIETFWARDGALLEEIATGYARWKLRVTDRHCAHFTPALRKIEAEAPLTKALRTRLDRAWGGRNNAMHAERAVAVRTDYRQSTPVGLRRMVDLDLPADFMASLATRNLSSD